MSTQERNPSERPGNQSLDAIADDERRAVLAALVGRSAMTERALAAELVAAERDVAPEAAPVEAVRTARIELYHVHLPALDDAGLVSWDRSAETVAAADHPLVRDDGFEALLGADADLWNAVQSCESDEALRTVLATLEAREGPVDRSTLARELAARDGAGTPSDGAVDDAEVRLHHSHLPRLADAGLVDYDPEAATAALGDDLTTAVENLLAEL